MEKKKKKTVFIIIGLTLISIVIIALLIMIPIWITKYKANKILEEQCKTYDLETKNELKKKLTDEEKNADYSDDGMTNIEKINKGLSIYTDDTDGDGLRDVDEINIYKSDPLKYSTAGDLFSDYYKVQNNLNVKKKIKGAPDIDIGVENIELIPKKATDEKATYEEYNGKIPSDYNIIAKPFIINGFLGEVKYKLNEEAKNCEVYSYDRLSTKISKISSKANGNDITFKNEDGEPILITYKPSYIKNIQEGKIDGTLNFVNTNEVEEEEKQYYVVVSFIPNLIFGTPIKVYEHTTSPTKLLESSDISFETKVNDAIKQFLKKNLSKDEYEFSQKTKLFNININHFYIGDRKKQLLENLSNELDIDILDNSITSFDDIRRGVKSLFVKVYKVNGTRQDMIQAVFKDELNEYLGYEVKEKQEEKAVETVLADSGFDVEKNAFHFENISTKQSEIGNCAGMSVIVANAYNGNNIPEQLDENTAKETAGEKFENFLRTYDISNEEVFGCITKNDTIGSYSIGRILETYSNATPDDDYTNDIKKALLGIVKKPILNTDYDIEENDIQLLRAIECFSKYMNSKKKYDPGLDVNEQTRKNKFSEIENLIEYVKNGNVALCDVFSKTEGHTMDIYKVERDPNDENIYYLRCYDNNLPMDTIAKKTEQGYEREKIENVIIKIVRHKMKNGEDTYDFSYDLFNNSNYRFRSKDSGRIVFYTSDIEFIK